MLKKQLIIIVFIFAVSSCASHPIRSAFTASGNRSNLLRLEPGMTKHQALDLMGEPYNHDRYGDVTYWLYVTSPTKGLNLLDVLIGLRGEITSQNLTPIFLKDDIVVGWGRNYWDNIDIRIDKTVRHR